MIGIETGIDLVRIDRLATLDPGIKARFIARVFTPREIGLCGGRDASLAGRFAAKEAAAKALGCGIGEVGWQEIEVIEDSKGRPMLLLHGKAGETASRSGWFSWSVSITHTSEFAAATVTTLLNRE